MSSLSPATVLMLLLATSSAALGHVLWGQRWIHLPIFWMAALLGCLLMYGLGFQFPHGLPSPAGVPVLEAVLVAWVLIIIASRLRV